MGARGWSERCGASWKGYFSYLEGFGYNWPGPWRSCYPCLLLDSCICCGIRSTEFWRPDMPPWNSRIPRVAPSWWVHYGHKYRVPLRQRNSPGPSCHISLCQHAWSCPRDRHSDGCAHPLWGPVHTCLVCGDRTWGRPGCIGLEVNCFGLICIPLPWWNRWDWWCSIFLELCEISPIP